VSGATDFKRERADPDPAVDRTIRLDFKVAVLATDGRCLAHDREADCEGDFHAHHVITQAQLRRAGRADLLWDPRNGMTVCELAHRRHHRGLQRIRLDRVPERAIRFATENGFRDILERYYATVE
jgi:hypothetical protein